MRAVVQGDAAGGWMAEVHDGDQLTTHSPDGETHPTMLHALWTSLRERFGSAWEEVSSGFSSQKTYAEREAEDATDDPAPDSAPVTGPVEPDPEYIAPARDA